MKMGSAAAVSMSQGDVGLEEKMPPRVQAKARTVDCCDLKRRFDQLKVMRSGVEQVWNDIERYFMPLGSGGKPYVQVVESSVEWRRPDVWDSTAIDAAQKLAASIHGSVTSPAIRWFKLAWRDEDLKKDVEAAKWLDDVGDDVFDCLQDSDFNTEIASADQDLVGYGNAFVIQEPVSETEWRGLDFLALHIREGYFEPDHKDQIKTFFRRLSWSAVQILSKFGKDGCPEHILKKAQDGKNLEERIEVVFCVFTRDDVVADLERRRGRNQKRQKQRLNKRRRNPVETDEVTYPLAPALRPFGFCYFLAENGDCLGEEGGYYEMPVMLARWQKTAGSMWGHGPCNILLPTVKYLNAYMELDHGAAAKVVDPATLVTERGLLSDLDLDPGGITVVRDVDKDVKVHESKARFEVSEKKLAELRGMVERGLHNNELTLKDSPAMTATEVTARYELMNRILGSTLSRIENDLLSPIVKNAIGHMWRAGQLATMPESVKRKFSSGEAEFNIEYQGPLSRAQRTDEVAAIERVLSFAAALLKMGMPIQVVMATIDVVAAIREVAKRLGTPADLLKPDKEVKAAIKAMEDQANRAANAQIKKTEGEAADAHASAAAQSANARGASAGAVPAGGVKGLPIPARPGPVVAPPYGIPQPNPTQPAEEQPA